jgi:hypothetical protein
VLMLNRLRFGWLTLSPVAGRKGSRGPLVKI